MGWQDESIGRRTFLKQAAVASACAATNATAQKNSTRTPNVLMILVDDLGYGDLGCYGNAQCETPNIDRLARQGMRFTNAYAPAPICSASRAAMLTGKTPARLNFEFVTKNDENWEDGWADRYPNKKLIPPVYTLNLPLEEQTLAEVCKSAGYTTGITGKWHVSAHHERYLGWSPTHGPLSQGFDWGDPDFGAHPYGYDKKTRDEFGDYTEGEFPEDALTQNAIEFMGENRENPFFLLVSHYHVHTPLGTKCKWLLEKYQEKLGDDPNKKRALYAAFVETLDHYVGELLDAVDNLGLADDTLVLFISDNGGHPEFAFNAPLRGSKWNLYEGGVRVPMIARWPGVVKEGSVSDAVVSGIDFLPTIREAVGATGEASKEIDGTNITPALRGETLSDRALVWHFPYYHPESGYDKKKSKIGIEDVYISQTEPQSSIRIGHEKLIYFHEDGRCELYDLAKDTSEQNDLADSHPERATELKEMLLDYLSSVNARFPAPNPSA